MHVPLYQIIASGGHVVVGEGLMFWFDRSDFHLHEDRQLAHLDTSIPLAISVGSRRNGSSNESFHNPKSEPRQG